MSASTKSGRRFGSALLGVASMAASLGAIAFLVTSDVAVAEEGPAVQAPAKVQAAAKPAPKARAKPRRKRIDLGRFEGY